MKDARIKHLRLHGNPNWVKGVGGNPDKKGLGKEAHKRRKLFSEFLHEYLEANPAKLRKLVSKAVGYALDGHARFLELILDRTEGPVKHDVPGIGTTFNFNFSEAERTRALESVENIKRMTIQLPPLLAPEKKEEPGAKLP
jgi:hypothetical protein